MDSDDRQNLPDGHSAAAGEERSDTSSPGDSPAESPLVDGLFTDPGVVDGITAKLVPLHVMDEVIDTLVRHDPDTAVVAVITRGGAGLAFTLRAAEDIDENTALDMIRACVSLDTDDVAFDQRGMLPEDYHLDPRYGHSPDDTPPPGWPGTTAEWMAQQILARALPSLDAMRQAAANSGINLDELPAYAHRLDPENSPLPPEGEERQDGAAPDVRIDAAPELNGVAEVLEHRLGGNKAREAWLIKTGVPPQYIEEQRALREANPGQFAYPVAGTTYEDAILGYGTEILHGLDGLPEIYQFWCRCGTDPIPKAWGPYEGARQAGTGRQCEMCLGRVPDSFDPTFIQTVPAWISMVNTSLFLLGQPTHPGGLRDGFGEGEA